jgi:hypothetical protein
MHLLNTFLTMINDYERVNFCKPTKILCHPAMFKQLRAEASLATMTIHAPEGSDIEPVWHLYGIKIERTLDPQRMVWFE